jgi:hypothetical protein
MAMTLLAGAANAGTQSDGNDVHLSLPEIDVTLSPPPVAATTTPPADLRTQTLVPLPAPVITGMVGLGVLGLARLRKPLMRFLS